MYRVIKASIDPEVKDAIDEEISYLLEDGETDISEVLDCVNDNQGIYIDSDDTEIVNYIRSKITASTRTSTKSSNGIDSVKFAGVLFDYLKQNLPKNTYPSLNPQYTEIEIHNYSNAPKVMENIFNYCELRGYESYRVDGQNFDIAVIQDERYIEITVDKYSSVDEAGKSDVIVSINYVNSNPIFEDWYEDWNDY